MPRFKQGSGLPDHLGNQQVADDERSLQIGRAGERGFSLGDTTNPLPSGTLVMVPGEFILSFLDGPPQPYVTQHLVVAASTAAAGVLDLALYVAHPEEMRLGAFTARRSSRLLAPWAVGASLDRTILPLGRRRTIDRRESAFMLGVLCLTGNVSIAGSSIADAPSWRATGLAALPDEAGFGGADGTPVATTLRLPSIRAATQAGRRLFS